MPVWQKVPATGRRAPRFARLPACTLLAGSLLLAGLLPAPAQAAATLSVFPLKLRLAPGRLADTVTLGNEGARAVTVEVRLFRWQYEPPVDGSVDAREQLTPTTELLATPPVFTLPPGGSRVVRVGRLSGRALPPSETGYRLELSEVPDEAGKPLGGGARTVLTLSLPVFIAPADRKAAPKPTASWLPAAAGAPARLRLANEGQLHARLTTARLVQQGKTCAEKTFGAYVLPGSVRQLAWPEASACAAASAALQLDFEGAPRRLERPLELGAAASPGTAPAPSAAP